MGGCRSIPFVAWKSGLRGHKRRAHAEVPRSTLSLPRDSNDAAPTGTAQTIPPSPTFILPPPHAPPVCQRPVLDKAEPNGYDCAEEHWPRRQFHGGLFACGCCVASRPPSTVPSATGVRGVKPFHTLPRCQGCCDVSTDWVLVRMMLSPREVIGWAKGMGHRAKGHPRNLRSAEHRIQGKRWSQAQSAEGLQEAQH